MGVIIALIIIMMSYAAAMYFYRYYSEKVSRIFGNKYMGSSKEDKYQNHPDSRVAGDRKQKEPSEKQWLDPSELRDVIRVQRFQHAVEKNLDTQIYEITRIAYDPNRQELVAVVKNTKGSTYLRKYESAFHHTTVE